MRISIFGLSIWDKPASPVKTPPKNKETNSTMISIIHRKLQVNNGKKNKPKDGSKHNNSVANVHYWILKKVTKNAPKQDVHNEIVNKVKENGSEKNAPKGSNSSVDIHNEMFEKVKEKQNDVVNEIYENALKVHLDVKYRSDASKSKVHSEILKQTKTPPPTPASAQSNEQAKGGSQFLEGIKNSPGNPKSVEKEKQTPPPLPSRPPASQSDEVGPPPPPPPPPSSLTLQNKEEILLPITESSVKIEEKTPKTSNSLLKDIENGRGNLKSFRKEESDPEKVKKEENTSKIKYGKIEENILAAMNKGGMNKKRDQEEEFDDTGWDDDNRDEAITQSKEQDQIGKAGNDKVDDADEGKVVNFSSSSPALLSVTPKKDRVDEAEKEKVEPHTRGVLLSTLGKRRKEIAPSDELNPDDWDEY